MSTDDHGPVEPITDHTHECSWSANLEREVHATDRELLLRQARQAVEHTAPGYHVNLVTHGEQGHPESYLTHAIRTAFDDVRIEYVQQCGCGGHVTRVHVD